MRRSLLALFRVQAGRSHRLRVRRAHSPANQSPLLQDVQEDLATLRRVALAETAVVATAADRLVVAVVHPAQVEDHVQFPVQVPHLQVAAEVVQVEVVQAAQLADAHRSGRDVVVVTAKNFSQ